MTSVYLFFSVQNQDVCCNYPSFILLLYPTYVSGAKWLSLELIGSSSRGATSRPDRETVTQHLNFRAAIGSDLGDLPWQADVCFAKKIKLNILELEEEIGKLYQCS